MLTRIVEKSDPSESSSGSSYDTICEADGQLKCNCRGWATKKKGKARTCKHIDKLLLKYQFTSADKGDYRYATAASAVQGFAKPSDDAKKLQGFLKANVAPKVEKKHFSKIPEVDALPPKKKFRTIPETDEDVAVFINPMLASPFPEGQTLANFCASEEIKFWALEEKFDGHRVVVTVNEGVVKAWSRPRQGKEPLVRMLPQQIHDEFARMTTATYDGELMIPGGKSYNVTDGKFAGTEIFVVFDILTMLGMSTVRESYDARRAYLTEIFKTIDDMTFVKLAESGKPSVAAVKAIWKRGGEGAILKRRLAYYQPGARSRDFIKVKAVDTVVMTVLGYTAGKQGPYSTVRVQDADGIETTVKTLDMDALNKFEADPESFIGRKLRIEYQERTPDGLYRHPRWDRWENE